MKFSKRQIGIFYRHIRTVRYQPKDSYLNFNHIWHNTPHINLKLLSKFQIFVFVF